MTRAGRALIGTAASAALLLSPAVAAADDGTDLSARQLAEQAQDHLLAARSVHLKLTDRSKGVNTSRTRPASMDLSLDRDGNCAGTLRMGAKGGSVEIIKRGDEVWMKPDTAFWKAQAPGREGEAIAELFKNRYIHGSTRDTLLKGMAGTCDLNTFQQAIVTPGSPSGGPALTKGRETKLHGTKVIPLTGEEHGDKAVLYVTSDSPHLLVEATQKGHGTDTTLTVTDYDKPVPSGTPSPDESVDVGKLRDELQGV